MFSLLLCYSALQGVFISLVLQGVERELVTTLDVLVTLCKGSSGISFLYKEFSSFKEIPSFLIVSNPLLIIKSFLALLKLSML